MIAQITGRGHATINAQQIITQEDAQSFMQEVNYITTKGHSIPGKAIVKIDMAKLIVSKGCFSENNIVLHENKLPLTLSVSIPAKIPGNPPQDDTVGMSSGEGTLIVSNFHVYADR